MNFKNLCCIITYIQNSAQILNVQVNKFSKSTHLWSKHSHQEIKLPDLSMFSHVPFIAILTQRWPLYCSMQQRCCASFWTLCKWDHTVYNLYLASFAQLPYVRSICGVVNFYSLWLLSSTLLYHWHLSFLLLVLELPQTFGWYFCCDHSCICTV